MRNLLLIFLLLTSYGSFAQKQVTGQPEETKKADKLTFFEEQKAFYDYLSSINGDKGYYLDRSGNKRKIPGYKQFKRYEYIWESRVDPKTGQFPDIGQYVFRNPHRAVSGDLKWESVGENQTTGGYQGIGRINCINFHPTDENIIFLGAPAGGFWKSVDAGENWVTTTDNLASIGVSDIVIHPEYNTNKTIFIATGDRDANDTPSVGVLKSTDEGETWIKTGLSFNTSDREYIYRLKQSPNNPDEIYACTSDGLYRTDDLGETWTKLSSTTYKDLEFNTSDGNIIYASSDRGKLYKSTDKGQTFDMKINTYGLNTRIAVTAANSEIIYLIASNNNRGLKGIYKSEDGGENFNQIVNGNDEGKRLLNWGCTGNGNNDGQAEYDLAFAVSPLDANLLFVGGVNTWRSEDGGENWDCVNMWNSSCYGIQAVHADKHVFEFRPNSSTLYEGNDGGIYITNDKGDTWTDLSNTLVIGQIYKIGVDQNNIGSCISGLQDNGSKLKVNNEWRNVLGGDGMDCLIDYENSNIQYAEMQGGEIYRTEDKWKSRNSISPSETSGPWVTIYKIDPKDPKTLYGCFKKGLYRSNNRGNTWTRLLSTKSSHFGSSAPGAVAIAPSNNKVIYVTAKARLKKSTDYGETWADLTLPTGVYASYIKSIAIKHDDPNTIWIGLSHYNDKCAYESTDGGETWTDISKGIPEIPVNSIVQYKTNTEENELYVGTDFGVYRKVGKADWHYYSQGLPNTKVTELEFYYDKSISILDKLYAATYGRGLWKIDMREKPEQYLSVNKDEIKFTDMGGSAEFNVASNGAWTVSNLTNWMTVSVTNGSHDMSVEITCTPNNGTKRTGSLTITNHDGLLAQIDVDQSNDNITLALNPSARTVTAEAGSLEFDVLCNHSFTLSENSDWLYLRSSSGSGNDKGRIRYYENKTTETRTAEITVRSGESVKTFVLTQEAPSSTNNLEQKENYISPNPTNDFIRINYDGKIKSISITDLKGRMIYFMENPINNYINVKDWATGPYVVNIETEKTVITETVIVTN